MQFARVGPYVVEEEIGRGGMGVVWRGRDPRLDRPVAIKAVSERLALDRSELESFAREARLLASVSHPHIAIVYDIEEVLGRTFLVLEYVPGESLATRLERGPMPLPEALAVARQIASALGAAHRKGVVHRDLKPANVRLTPEGTAKVLDFGLAIRVGTVPRAPSHPIGERVDPGSALPPADAADTWVPSAPEEVGADDTRSSPDADGRSGAGTPGYMSPEQARGAPADVRADVWAFACLLFECLTARKLWEGRSAGARLRAMFDNEPDLSPLPKSTPARVRSLLESCLARDPDQRPADLDAIGVELEEALADLSARRVALPAPARAPAPVPPPVAPLPRSLSSFVGRTRELSEIGLLLAQFPLVTLTGIGGCGKTRLALEAARELGRRGDGVVAFAELAPVGDAGGVVPAVAGALGLQEEPGRPLLETVMETLTGRPLLLVLDNCEHLLDPVAELLGRILPAAPLVRVLATSREPLGIGGERTFFVRSLALPPEESAAAFADLAACDAVRLFVERATTVAPGFTLTEGSAVLIGQLVRRLDGIPLAIELAAARVRSLPLSQIVKRLDDRFRLLAGGSRAAIERHQTLRAAIDWSWEHLSGPERVLFRRTGSFAGGFTLEAAEAVAVDAGREAGLERAEVADVLGRLVDKSLVLFEPELSRYSLLETVRQYARERLVASREAERVGTAHQKTFLALAREAKTRLRGPERGAWLDRLEREHANLLAALDWRDAAGTAATGAVERALQLVDALTGFWEARGHVTRIRPRVDALLAEENARAATTARAWALNGAGILAYRESDAPGARRRYEEMLAIARALGDRRAIAVALHNLSNVIAQEGDQACARALLEESVATHREMGSHWDVANGLINLGLRARDAGEPAAAESFLRDALTIARPLGDKQQIAIAFTGLAWVAIDRKDLAAAPLAEEALALFREIGHREFAAECTACLGLCALAAGDVAGARARIVEALSALEEIGHPVPVSSVLGWAALVDAAGDRPARAAQLLGAAETLRETIGAPLASPEKAHLLRGVATLRALLGDAAFERERAVGRTYDMGQAIDRALGRER